MTRSIYDISVPLSERLILYPGDDPIQRQRIRQMESGDDNNDSRIEMSLHAGTHIDAPRHFFREGASIDQIPLTRFLLPAWVWEIPPIQDRITAEDLRDLPLQPGEAVLFRTGNTTRHLLEDGIFTPCYTSMTLEATHWLISRQAFLVGIDYLSIDSFESTEYPVHRLLAEAGILVLENAWLTNVPSGRYTLMALPLHILDAEASPVRAVLMQS